MINSPSFYERMITVVWCIQKNLMAFLNRTAPSWVNIKPYKYSSPAFHWRKFQSDNHPTLPCSHPLAFKEEVTVLLRKHIFLPLTNSKVPFRKCCLLSSLTSVESFNPWRFCIYDAFVFTEWSQSLVQGQEWKNVKSMIDFQHECLW